MAVQRIKKECERENVRVLGNAPDMIIIDDPLYNAEIDEKKSASASVLTVDEKKSAGGHGGTRQGAGRKRVADKARQRNVIANNEEWDEVKRRAAAAGYESVSAFVLDRVLCRN